MTLWYGEYMARYKFRKQQQAKGLRKALCSWRGSLVVAEARKKEANANGELSSNWTADI